MNAILQLNESEEEFDDTDNEDEELKNRDS